MSISQNDTLHDAQAQMIEACSESVAPRPKGSRSSRLFVGLPYNGLTSESVEDEAGAEMIVNEAERRWNSGEDALRLVIDTTPALIHTGRPDGYLDYFNQRWLEFLGLPLEKVCGWRWTGAVHPEDIAGLLQKWHAALGSGEPLEAEARVRRVLHERAARHSAYGRSGTSPVTSSVAVRATEATWCGNRRKSPENRSGSPWFH